MKMKNEKKIVSVLVYKRKYPGYCFHISCWNQEEIYKMKIVCSLQILGVCIYVYM